MTDIVESNGICRDLNVCLADKLQAEIERLREHRDHMRAVVECAGFGSVTEALVEIERLRARLAEAVALLIAWDNDYPHDINDALDDCAEKTSAFLDKLEARTDD